MEINSDDYHDYVFKQGKFVGEFEQMYRKSKDLPWHQDKVPQLVDLGIVRTMASLRSPHETILDVGCGLGFLANELAPFGRKVYGIDVSPTAIQDLKVRFPHIDAAVVDVTELQGERAPVGGVSTFDLVVCRGFFWMVFPHMPHVVTNVLSWVKDGGRLMIHQNFPDLNKAFVGKDVIPNPERLLELFLERGGFKLVYTNVLIDLVMGKGNDNWYTFVLEKSARDTPPG